VLLNPFDGFFQAPAGDSEQEVEPVASPSVVVLPPALIAVPGAWSVVPVPTESVGALTGRAGLVLICQLIGRDSTEGDKDVGPMVMGGFKHLVEGGR
jgi:hypothetical protein